MTIACLLIVLRIFKEFYCISVEFSMNIYDFNRLFHEDSEDILWTSIEVLQKYTEMIQEFYRNLQKLYRDPIEIQWNYTEVLQKFYDIL